MNTNRPRLQIDQISPSHAAGSLSHSLLRSACQDDRDYLTPVLSAFLVACMLVALAMCSVQVGDWKTSPAPGSPTTVAAGSFSVSGQHVF